MKPSVSNVLSVYNNASAHSLRTGLSWYNDAHNFARLVGGGRPHHVARNAGIIAALSPLNGWNNNKRVAAKLISQRGRIVIGPDGSNGIGLSMNVNKAIRIYNGEEPLDAHGGTKVRAFYETILDPTGDNNPVIDRHAFDIAVGKRTPDSAKKVIASDKGYSRFAMVYREAAEIAGIGASQMQAITWVAWREDMGVID